MDKILHFEQVGFSIGGVTLLSGIDFSVKKGQITGLLGVNGAGKSTTLKIASGILLPDSGIVKRDNLTSVGYLPENPPLIGDWTVIQFLKHVCFLQNLPKNLHKDAIERVIKHCHLQKIMTKTISILSKGNQQRVAIAQSIIHQPDLLLLDEPTSGLDPEQIIKFRAILKSIKVNTAIILSSHVMQEVMALCDDVVIIHNGKQISHLDLSMESCEIMIRFAEAVPVSAFSQIPEWLSGDGEYHQFTVISQAIQDQLLLSLLSAGLSIKHVYGSEQRLENKFMMLIGHSMKDNAL